MFERSDRLKSTFLAPHISTTGQQDRVSKRLSGAEMQSASADIPARVSSSGGRVVILVFWKRQFCPRKSQITSSILRLLGVVMGLLDFSLNLKHSEDKYLSCNRIATMSQNPFRARWVHHPPNSYLLSSCFVNWAESSTCSHSTTHWLID